MRPVGIVSTAVLSLLLGSAAPVFARQGDPQPAARPQQEHPQEQKPEAKPEQPKAAQPEEKRTEQPKQEQREEKVQQKEDKRENQGQQKEEKREQKQEKREVKTVRIPEERFRANFGRAHVFRINRPVIVEGVPRFQFGGFWFGIVEPWPVGWYYTDEVYVDYIDGGYYLINPLHPGIRIVVNVVP